MVGEVGLLVLVAGMIPLLTYGDLLADLPPLLVGGAVCLLLLAAGCAAGLQYPPAVRLLQGERPDGLGSGVGTVYAADLAGGWLGGVLGGLLFLPFFGPVRSCALLAAVKSGSLLLLQMQRKRGKI
jgi:spermidine synthase